jgi:hypothetical protein
VPWHYEEVTEKYGIAVDALPRGVLVGTVEIVDCEDLGGERFGWYLARPARANDLASRHSVRNGFPFFPRRFEDDPVALGRPI